MEKRDKHMAFPTQRPPTFPANPMRPFPIQQMPRNMMMNPSQGFNRIPGASNPLKGILGRLFQPQAMQTGALPTSGTNGIGGFANTLNNVQQVLKMAQSAAPVVQQYGPMVKNLPMMFKMLKALNSDDDDSETDDDNLDDKNELTLESPKTKKTSDLKDVEQKKIKKSTSSGDGLSKPKLYI